MKTIQMVVTSIMMVMDMVTVNLPIQISMLEQIAMMMIIL